MDSVTDIKQFEFIVERPAIVSTVIEIWVLKSELAKDTAMAANYEEIARSISRIKHSNFVQIWASAHRETTVYSVRRDRRCFLPRT